MLPHNGMTPSRPVQTVTAYTTYRVIEENRSIFWELLLSSHMNMWLIFNGYQNRDLWICLIPIPNFFRCLRVGLKEEKSLATQDESLAGLLDLAARIKTRKNQLRRTARDFRIRVAKWIEVEVGIFEHVS